MVMKALSKPTVYQVAQLAGVSIATVSRALRGSDLVAEQTRARVLEAARTLRFTPSRLGRSLAEIDPIGGEDGAVGLHQGRWCSARISTRSESPCGCLPGGELVVRDHDLAVERL